MFRGTPLLATVFASLTSLIVRSATPSPPEGEVGISRDGGAIRLTIRGDDGKEYSLESLEALLNAGQVWKPVATIAPSQQPVVLYDPFCSTRPQSFYRLRLLAEPPPPDLPNFRLVDTDGQSRELYYESDARGMVLIFAGTTLESLRDQQPPLSQLIPSFEAKGIRFRVLTATTAADRPRLQMEKEALGLTIPVLEDEAGVVSRQLGCTTVPSAMLVDFARWEVAYQGRLSDPIDASTTTSTPNYLEHALTRLIEGSPVEVRHVNFGGNPLPQVDVSDSTYSETIAPLLQARCVSCHSPGNIAPWAMTNHTVVREYANRIKDEVLTRRMPPWHADRAAPSYANDGMLTGEEMAQLVEWIDRGAPRSEAETDPLADSVPPPPPDWPLGTPDRIVTLQTQSIPAAGTVDYRYLVVPNPFPTDVWLRAAVVRPGNARVVHHVLVFSASTFSDLLEVQGGLGGYFAGYVPGMEQSPYPEGTGKRLKAGSFFVFQLHYTATGAAETDRTSIGLYVAPTPPPNELRTSAAYDLGFTIPPGNRDYRARAEYQLARDAVLYEMSPHMHYRGKWFRFDAIYPDGRRETLLNVPFYRFDWQTLYRLAEPKALPAGTRLVIDGGWDNSSRNPYNPNPAQTVRFGEQSWEEMFIGYFNFAEAR